jgi:hypothetical protein
MDMTQLKLHQIANIKFDSLIQNCFSKASKTFYNEANKNICNSHKLSIIFFSQELSTPL